MSVLLDIAYGAVLAAASPVWLYKMIRHGRYRDDIGQRFGSVPVRTGEKTCIWVHGVSLGEVNASKTLVAALEQRMSDCEVVVSTSTETGMAAAKRIFLSGSAGSSSDSTASEPGSNQKVFRWPLDFSSAVRKALKRIRPSLVVLMEGEVWPNFCSACNRMDIPVVVVNARMSTDKGYPGYKKLGRLAAKLFNRVTAFGVQEESYATLYRKLGVDESKLHITGMLKFDSADVADSAAGQDALAAALGISADDKLIVAGGTGPGEEQILLDMFTKLRAGGKHPAARLVVVPRKPERFDEVARLIESAGFGLVRRSQQPDGGDCAPPAAEERGKTVILGDTMGELRKFYGLASCIFVGRALVEMGGSDMIEAAALGKATAFGPHTFNFPQADALAANGCVRVPDAAALGKQLAAWLADPAAAAAAGTAAQAYVRSQQGATQRSVDLIYSVLESARK